MQAGRVRSTSDHDRSGSLLKTKKKANLVRTTSSAQIRRFLLTLCLLLTLSGCGIAFPEVNEPELAFRSGRDGHRIADWTLRQTNGDSIEVGLDALSYAMTRDPRGVSDGWTRIAEKLRTDWPGLSMQTKSRLLNLIYEEPAFNWRATGREVWRDIFL